MHNGRRKRRQPWDLLDDVLNDFGPAVIVSDTGSVRKDMVDQFVVKLEKPAFAGRELCNALIGKIVQTFQKKYLDRSIQGLKSASTYGHDS